MQSVTGVVDLSGSIASMGIAASVVSTDSFPFITSGGVGYRATATLLRDYVLTISGGTATIAENLTITGALTANGNVTLGNANTDTISALGAVSLSPANANVVISPTGTGLVTIAPATAGTLNNIVIGGVTPLAGTFTTLGGTLSTALQPNVTTMTGLTTIGTLVAGAVPASLVTAGTFGTGAYTFPSTLVVTTSVSTPIVTTTSNLSLETTAATAILFATNSTARGRIDSVGDLLLGGTSKTTPLALNRGVYVQSQTDNDAIGYSLYVNEGSNGRRASFFLDDANARWGHQMGYTSGEATYVVRTAAGGGTDLLLLNFAGATFSSALTQNGTTAALVQSATTATLDVGSATLSTGSSQIRVNSAAGSQAIYWIRTLNSSRWAIYKNGSEAGSDAGANLTISAYTDAGALIDNPLVITRAAGGTIAFSSARPITGGTYNGQTISSAASFTGTVTAATGFRVNPASLGVEGLIFQDAAVNRVVLRLDSATQWGLYARTITGTAIDAPIVITTTANAAMVLGGGGRAVQLVGGSQTNALQVTTTGAITSTFRYDSSNRLDIAVSSAGAVTYAAVGASAGHTFSNNLTVSGSATRLGNQTGTFSIVAVGSASGTTPGVVVALQGTVAGGRYIDWMTGTSSRWRLAASTTAESGANAGSGFTLTSFDDTGVAIDTVLSITRASAGLISWNSARFFQTGNTGVGGASASATAALITPASTTGVSSLRIPHGVAPSSPVNGDLWTTTSGAFAYINGVTTPLGGGTGDVVGPASATDNAIVRYDGTTGKLVQDGVGWLITDAGILHALQTVADTDGYSIRFESTDTTVTSNRLMGKIEAFSNDANLPAAPQNIADISIISESSGIVGALWFHTIDVAAGDTAVVRRMRITGNAVVIENSRLEVNTSGAGSDSIFGGATKSGVLAIRTASDSLSLFGTTIAPSFQSGVGIMHIANATTVPTGNPTGGGFLYAESGAFKWRESGGGITTLGANATFPGSITTSAPTGGAGAWELGVANVVSPTAPDRTITVEIGGVAYYLHAKTTND